MTGKAYYLTTLGDWQRHAARFANSHWIALDAGPDCGRASSSGSSTQAQGAVPIQPRSIGDATRILVLIEADEGAHLALEDDPAFETLPHPLAQQAVSVPVQGALAPLGVASGATTFEVAEAAARIHPLLRHRVF